MQYLKLVAQLAVRRAIAVAAIAGAGVVLSSVSARGAAIVANFTGGNDTTDGGTATPGADTYFGIAGGGWAAGWGQSAAGGTITSSVVSTSQLNNGGNYVSMTGSAGGDSAISRSYLGGGIAPSAPETVSVDFRLDSTLSGTGTNYVTIADTGSSPAQAPSSSSSYIIRAYGGALGTGNSSSGQGNVASGDWAFYNGTQNGAGFTTNDFVDSGLKLIQGDVYTFTINLNPAATPVSGNSGTYTAKITDDTLQSSVTSGLMGFRTAGALPETFLVNSNGSGAATGITDSVDSVSISTPEPASLSFLLLGGVGLLARRRRA